MNDEICTTAPMGPAPGMVTGLSRLASMAADRSASSDALIADAMALVADTLEVGLMHLSRREGDMMHYDRVHDRTGMGLPEGTVVPLAETYCATMLADAVPALVVEDARVDPRFADKEATRLLGIGAYSGVPLYRSDGQLYGTLCALHPAPRRAQDEEVALLQLAGRIIMGAVETTARAEEALRANEGSFRLLFAANPLPMWVYDLETLRFLEVNEAAVRHYGYARDEFLAMRIDNIRPPEDVAALETLVQARQADLQYSADWRHRLKDGRVVDVTIRSHRLTFAGRPASLVLAQDVTERKRAEEALRKSEADYRHLFEQANDAILIIDPDGEVVLDVNDRACALYGLARDAFVGANMTALARESSAGAHHIRATLDGRASYEFESVHLRADGAPFDVAITATPITFGGRAAVLSFNRDITARARAEEALRHQARHDSLTDLPNRTLLNERLDEALAVAACGGHDVALLLMDIDRFKEVNDTFGHHMGDLLLQRVARRLSGAIRASDTVARLGGDEFAVLLPTTDTAGAEAVARALLAVLDAPVELEGQALHVGASIGVALAPDHGSDGTTLLRRADVVMYAAKRAHLGHAVYDPSHDGHDATRLTLAGDLSRALARDELELHYQPQVAVASGQAVGVEALVRWRHPLQGLIPPDRFIPLAEQTGLIRPLTLWVLEAALRQSRVWARDGLDLNIAVNLSTWDLHAPDLPEIVAGLLVRYHIPAGRLCLELTESAVMADVEGSRDVLARLDALGVRLAVDDFGTGYSSLAYLARLPVDELKIDRSFVQRLTTDASDATIVASTIGLGHSLGLTVVVEGVEDAETWALLGQLSCDTAQGYYLSRPLPAAELERWLRRPQAVA